MKKWRGDLQVTRYVHKKFNDKAKTFARMTFQCTGNNHFIVTCNPKDPGKLRQLYRMNTSDLGDCSCSRVAARLLPCVHLLFILQRTGTNAVDFCCQPWLKQMYLNAYTVLEPDHPLTLMTDLRPDQFSPPVITKRRGRPRK